MSPALRNDLLMLVHQQIDSNLGQIADVTAAHANAPDKTGLTACVALAHQVGGVLRMVQLPGAARVSSEIETALKAALREAPADAAEVDIAGRAAHSLREFINEVAGGGSYVPLRLFPVYREVARVGGNASATEKDLFFPDAHDPAPAHANPRSITPAVLPALVKDLRSRFQRGLLAWLKESAKADGPVQMRQVLDQLYQITAQLPEPRGLWWAAVTLMDGVIELLPNLQAAEWIARVKPVCSRIDFLLRDLAANAKVDAAPAQRDVYYAIASCRVPTPRLREAQRLLQLEDLIPDTRAITGELLSQQPLLDDACSRLENIKDVWTEYAAGEPNRLARFRELLTPLTHKARELGNLPLLQLLLAVGNATARLPDPYPLDGQVMSLEMASALLMAESIITHYHDLPADLEQQVGIMKDWLAEAVAGKLGTSSPDGLRADIVQKANDEKLRIATAGEILKNLEQVERAVEAYASDPSKRNTLAPLVAVLRQVEGVFEVLNEKRAARLALACQHLVERCSMAPAGESQRDIEWLAEGLGCLGFYLDPCLHGKPPAERAINLYFTRYENKEGLEALLSLSQQISVAAPVQSAAQTVPALPKPPGADREMLDVFLEEANEVLTAMEAKIAQARTSADDGDALIHVRRGFHTLKGSSRMVGLADYGEFAWELEQMMNHWLAQTLPAMPSLLDVCSDARDAFAEWAHALHGEAAPVIDTAGIVARARALRGAAAPQVSQAQAQTAAALTTASSNATTVVRLPIAAQTVSGLQDMQTLMTSATGKMRTAKMPAAQDLAAAPVAVTEVADTAHPVTADLSNHLTVPRMTAGTAPHQQTLADLGDRLSWIGGLVEQMQQQSQGAANPRLTEIAGTLSDSLAEARDLHRQLSELLAANPR